MKANSSFNNKARAKAAHDPNQMDLFNTSTPTPQPTEPDDTSESAELSSNPGRNEPADSPLSGEPGSFDEFTEDPEPPADEIESQVLPEDIGEPPAIRLDFPPSDAEPENEADQGSAADSSTQELAPQEITLPPRADIPGLHPAAPSSTAEERLLDTIRGPEAPLSGEDLAAVQELEERMGKLRTELEELREAGRVILADRDDAMASARKAGADAERLQARCRELETELAGARNDLAAERRARAEDAAKAAGAERSLKQRLSETDLMLDEARDARDRLARRWFTPVSLAAAALLAAAAAGVTALAFYQKPAQDVGLAVPTPVMPIAPAVKTAALAVKSPAAPVLASRPRPPAAPAAVSTSAVKVAVAPAPVSPWPAIKIARIRTSVRTDQEMALVFTYGVFTRKTELSPQAQDDLRQLAKVLKPYSDRVRLTIEGFTDTAPVTSKGAYTTNDELALSRARVVRDLLCKETAWPASAAAVTAGKQGSAPYPNDTPESQLKNRTVVIKLRWLPAVN